MSDDQDGVSPQLAGAGPAMLRGDRAGLRLEWGDLSQRQRLGVCAGWAVAATLLLGGCPTHDPAAGQSAPADAPHSPPASRNGPKEVDSGSAAGSASAAFGERTEERDQMVLRTIQKRGVGDRRVLVAMRRVPRHRFVPKTVEPMAYEDHPLPIGEGQTISQPYIVAFMTEAAAPGPQDKCLEIGTGSGYQAAVLAELCKVTFSIEYLRDVAEYGERNLRRLGYGSDRVKLRVGDGYRGWPDVAPFQVILVTAAPEAVPTPLLAQLTVGGRLIIPVGPQHTGQDLERWTRLKPGNDRGCFRVERLMGVRFVPFLGTAGANK